MAKPSKELANVDVSESADSAFLATVRDMYPALTEKQRSSVRAWSEYAEFLDLPFLPKTSAAEERALFTIKRLGERTAPSVNDPNELVEQWVLAVQLDQDATLYTRNTGEPRFFAKGSRALVALPKGEGLRNQTITVISSILAQEGELPGMYLHQLPNKKNQAHNGPIILRSALTAADRGYRDDEPAQEQAALA